jgi:hypothetical protein
MKLPAPDTPLGLLLARLADWNSIVDFEQAMRNYFSGKRSEAEIADFRAKRGAVKVLRDEVSPVLHHLRFVKAKGEVKFALDNTVPDCWLREDPEEKPTPPSSRVVQSCDIVATARHIRNDAITFWAIMFSTLLPVMLFAA